MLGNISNILYEQYVFSSDSCFCDVTCWKHKTLCIVQVSWSYLQTNSMFCKCFYHPSLQVLICSKKAVVLAYLCPKRSVDSTQSLPSGVLWLPTIHAVNRTHHTKFVKNKPRAVSSSLLHRAFAGPVLKQSWRLPPKWVCQLSYCAVWP